MLSNFFNETWTFLDLVTYAQQTTTPEIEKIIKKCFLVVLMIRYLISNLSCIRNVWDLHSSYPADLLYGQKQQTGLLSNCSASQKLEQVRY